ncbi:hypothetical protein, partial [Lactobacillus delbrueckii]|uniref:hypothetical protein n=1 Tax=Lactobacillus delbrueckii TaxID=1584 RepID=UPI0022E25421
TLTPNLTAFTGVDSQNLLDVMVSVQFILAIGEFLYMLQSVITISPSYKKFNIIFLYFFTNREKVLRLRGATL